MPQQINTDRMVWVDLETFGLDPVRDPVLEIGFVITDANLKHIDSFCNLVWDSPVFDERFEVEKKLDTYVYKLHGTPRDGITLWRDAMERGIPVNEAREALQHWLSGHGVDRGDALWGSSVAFDRGFLDTQYGESATLFSYRNADVSTLKEMCARLNPELFAQLDKTTNPKKHHRVLDDITDTINEFKFYRREFLLCDEERSDYGE